MSLNTISNLKDSVAGIISGIDLGTVDNIYGAFERAAKVMVQTAFIPEAVQKQNIVLFDGVLEYPGDERMFGTQIVDIRPLGISRQLNDFVYKNPGEVFDRTNKYLSNGTMCSISFNDGAPILNIKSAQVKSQLTIDPMTDTSGWALSGDAISLVSDSSFFYQQPSSLRFNQTASGILTKTLTSPLDLTTYQGVGTAFLALELPNSTAYTSVTLKIGSDASNYYQVTQTSSFTGTMNSGEFNLIPFDLNGATVIGNPAITNIKYVQVTLTTSSAQNNVRVGGLWLSLPYPAQILFQTASIFKHGTNNASSDITDDNDIIILSDSTYNIFEYEAALAIIQQVGGGDSDPTVSYLEQKLHGRILDNKGGLYFTYLGDNPSEELRTLNNYYN